MSKPTFHEWLKSRGIDETALSHDRRRQLENFYDHDTAEPPLPAAHSADGQALAIGDTVTLTLKVTGFGRVFDPATGRYRDDVHTVALARVVDGADRHFLCCRSDWVEKKV